MARNQEDTIAKLLIKAENEATTPAEAESLMAIAEGLMIKYGIERAQIDAKRSKSGKGGEEIVNQHLVFKGEYRDAHADMGAQIVRAFGGMTVYVNGGSFDATRKTGRVLYIAGFSGDVESMLILLSSLHIQAVNALSHFESPEGTKPSVRLRQRREFIRAFGMGAATRIQEAHNAAIRDLQVSAPGTELVLQSREDRVNSWLKDNGINLKATKSRRSLEGVGDARAQGFRKGREASTGESQVGGKRSALVR